MIAVSSLSHVGERMKAGDGARGNGGGSFELYKVCSSPCCSRGEILVSLSVVLTCGSCLSGMVASSWSGRKGDCGESARVESGSMAGGGLLSLSSWLFSLSKYFWES